MDDVIRETGLPWRTVSATLGQSEIRRLTARAPGGRLVVSKLGERALEAWKKRD
jgi:hypothetical protein